MFLVLTALMLALNLFTQPATAQETKRPFEVVAELPEGPVNIAVTPQGRIVSSMHQFFGPEHRARSADRRLPAQGKIRCGGESKISLRVGCPEKS
jgi:hypothetical protein